MIESAIYVAITLMFSLMLIVGLFVFEFSDRNIFAMILSMTLVFLTFLMLFELMVVSLGGTI